jgi:hypothetical protein
MHPCLEVADRPVRAGQQLLAGRSSSLRASAVVVAMLGQNAVGLQAVGVDDRAGRCRVFCELR